MTVSRVLAWNSPTRRIVDIRPLSSSYRIEENAFQDLWDMEKLYLSKNGISGIYRDTFRNLPSLEKLYLDDNLVKDIGRQRENDSNNLIQLLSIDQTLIQSYPTLIQHLFNFYSTPYLILIQLLSLSS